MSILGHHPADPQHPKGMAWAMAAGFPDPRGGTFANQQLVLIQGWDAWSEQLWDFGFRWHPELQKKWVTGGGQFAPGTVVTEKPADAPSFEDRCVEVLDMIAETDPAFVAELKRIREEGTETERASALSELNRNLQTMAQLTEYMKGGGSA